ncbi:wax ester/triacylglycerol synthase family O-acyltransferase [Rhodoferax sp. U2-2l]|uniref:wax ester/triacylglycerol synthase family O-acyltransferase n=1 Tax=Rhodoferax sp. U2-2l TaxID=2884000 RepID=UPI001D0A219D|nr:wax ester/triacylglycerol synthase family O-acyltransferase [Rhodoferax sp. U2-2l]MCB8747125.1 wax ester/triacylglycerol synthase family O-acyltransferase [Rhodoferax sp. U2-2l]
MVTASSLPHIVERMSKVDTAWLRMDSPSNLMMILGVWILKPAVRYADVRDRLAERLLKYPRFSQRVQMDATGASWVTDTRFDITRHVRLEKLPAASKKHPMQALQARLAELAMQPLDRRYPLWDYRLVEHFDGGSVLIVRIHHCIADGLALLSVIQSMVDGGMDPPQRAAATASLHGLEAAEEWMSHALIEPLTVAAVKALEAAGDGAAQAFEAVADPRHVLDKWLTLGLNKSREGSSEAARLAYQVLRDGAALALMTDDSPTRLKGTPGHAKRVAWCQPIPLDEVRAVSKALRCSINDVLLSCVAGAVGQYLKNAGDDVTDQEIRAMVPVNLRPMTEAYKLGNKFGLAPVVLPLGLDNPIERVFEVRRRMSELKGSLQPLLAFGLLAVAGILVKPVQDAMLSLFSKKTTAVMTNVPGPREKLHFCGATLEQALFWVPQSGSVGLGVSILSYGGGVQFGIISDSMLCPDPQAIIDQFAPEFEKLKLLTLMLPWGEG